MRAQTCWRAQKKPGKPGFLDAPKGTPFTA